MPRQYLVPGRGIIDETGSRQYLVPGWGVVDETQSSGSVGSASGTSTASAVGVTAAVGTGSSAGSSTAEAFSPSSISDGQAAGTSTASGIGASLSASSGTSAGTSSATGEPVIDDQPSDVKSYLVPGWGIVNETGPRQYMVAGRGVVNETQLTGSFGRARGTSTTTGVGASLARTSALSAGTSTVTGAGNALVTASGSSAGTSTATGDAEALLRRPVVCFSTGDYFNYINLDRRAVSPYGVGNADGTSAALATGRALSASAGTAAGASTVTGVVSGSVISSAGTAAGTSTASAISADASIPVLPSLTGSSYVAAQGSARMLTGYTGNLYRLYCATGTPTAYLDIPQGVDGRPDESGIATWSGGSTAVFVDGTYNAVTGNYVPTTSAGKRPLYRNKEDGLPVFSTGYGNTGSLALSQGLPSEDFSIDRQNCAMFVVTRTLGAGLAMQHGGLENASAASVMTLISSQPTGSGGAVVNTFGSTTGNTACLPPIQALEVLGFVGTPTATKIHVGSRVTTTTANTSATATRAWMGRNVATTSRSSMAEYAALVVVSPAPSDSDAAAIKTALKAMFPIPATRTNVCVVTPNSLSFNGNLEGYNLTPWYYSAQNLTKPCEFGLIGVSGRKLSEGLAQIADFTAAYEASAPCYAVIIAPAVNDVQALSSGFAGGSPSAITAAATTIYNTAISYKNALKAHGSNVAVAFELPWPTPAFWSGTSQDKADKAAVEVQVDQMLAANTTSGGYSVIDNRSINMTGAFPSGDAVHTNYIGNSRREPNITAWLETVLV